MKYAIVHTVSAGNVKHNVIQAWITAVPDDVKPPAVKDAVLGSSRIGEWTEYGIPLANRRILPESRVPADAVVPAGTTAASIPWSDLEKTEMVQWNVRVSASRRQAWTNAAERAGMKVNPWALSVLDAAAEAGK